MPRRNHGLLLLRDISPRVWNRILLAAGVIYSAIIPFEFLALITGRLDPIVQLFRAVVGGPAPQLFLVASFFPIVAMIYSLLYREADRSALALVVLTVLNIGFILFIFLIAFIFSMLSE